MNNYIATFYTHHDALIYKRDLDKINVKAKLMPVPRKLSSSCGTCINFEALANQLKLLKHESTEMVVCCEGKEYQVIIDNR